MTRLFYNLRKKSRLLAQIAHARKHLQELPKTRNLKPYGGDDPNEPFVVCLAGDGEIFSDYRDNLARALSEAGATVKTCARLSEVEPLQNHAVVTIGLHKHNIRKLPGRDNTCLIAGIQTEQVASSRQGARTFGTLRAGKIIDQIKKYDLVFDWSQDSVRSLRRYHHQVIHLPHGGMQFQQFGPNTWFEKYDLVLLGNINSPTRRRRQILDTLRSRYRVFPQSEGVWGTDKITALMSSKIVLNLHVESSLVFESPRFFEALSLQRFLLSEGVLDPHPFVAGVDYVEAELPGLIGTIDLYLNDDNVRREIAMQGYKRTREYSIERTASRMLGILISQNRLLNRNEQ